MDTLKAFTEYRHRLQEHHRVHDLEKSIIEAAVRGDTASVLSALDSGAGIEAGAGGWTPLLMAATNGNPETVEALLKRGANVNASDEEHHITSLMQAVAEGDLRTVQLLLAAGADVNSWDWESRTPLDYAVLEDRQEISDLLRSAGGEIGPEAAANAAETDDSA